MMPAYASAAVSPVPKKILPRLLLGVTAAFDFAEHPEIPEILAGQRLQTIPSL
jgi:hypothetical protein